MWIFWIFVGVLIGFGLYHWVLGQAGWAGRFVQRRVDKRLKKIGRSIGIISEVKKPETGSKFRGHGLRKRN